MAKELLKSRVFYEQSAIAKETLQKCCSLATGPLPNSNTKPIDYPTLVKQHLHYHSARTLVPLS